jgi:hypothetical protein
MIFVHIAIYCIAISTYLFFTIALNPRYWLHRLPKAMTEKVPPRTKKEIREITLLGIPFLAFMLAYPLWYAAANVSGWPMTVFVLFSFYAGFTVWDTLVLDLLLVCTITPRFMIIEGTSREDYKDKVYHLKGGLKGLVLSAAASLILGSLVYLAKLIAAGISG